jgi:hypothetical protein
VASNYRKIALNRRVIVNLTTGQALEGVLWDGRGPLVVLRNARLHEPGSSGSAPVDGEVVVERERIAFVQVVT